MIAKSSSFFAILAKIVDDLLLYSPCQIVDRIVESITKTFTLGTITHGTGLLRYYGLNITQNDDYSVKIDGNDNLQALDSHLITRACRRELKSQLNAAEAKAFSSINSSVGWL